MILDPSTKAEAVLAGAVSANQPEVHVEYRDWNPQGETTKPALFRVALNSASDVTILAAPIAGFIREVLRVSIYNKDTASVTVTVKTDDGTTERIINQIALATLATLHFEQDTGWYVTTGASGTSVNLITGPENLLINPNWLLDQINGGALYTFNSTTAVGPDGWTGIATGAGTFKLRTLADPDDAALKCLEITCTGADAAIAATDNYLIYTGVEGYDAAALMAGTASAQPITIQFKFKTNVTGVYGLFLKNSASNRRYIGTITVSDTNEHEYSLSLTMDTAGTWLYTSGVGLFFGIQLAGGANFQATAGAWAAGGEQTTAAQCNFMSANTNVAYLKRIQLIPGALVQAYKPADITAEYAKAKRYYEKVGFTLVSNIGGANAGYPTFLWNVEKRATPTITLTINSGTGATAAVFPLSPTTGGYQTAGNSVDSDGLIVGNARLS